MKIRFKVSKEKVGQDGWDTRWVIRLNGLYVSDFNNQGTADYNAEKLNEKSRDFFSVGGLEIVQ